MKGGLLVSLEREELRRLVDELLEKELNAARRYLEFIRHMGKDPVRWALGNAPLDDEPVTYEERERVAQADAGFRARRSTSMDEVKRALGLWNTTFSGLSGLKEIRRLDKSFIVRITRAIEVLAEQWCQLKGNSQLVQYSDCTNNYVLTQTGLF